ncbi:MAG: glycosyltransferase family 9 protein [Deltaproteobacteria bacterium]|nr:glycosyltransferase family 9 protein [Deltaproteobacteria bacterium]
MPLQRNILVFRTGQLGDTIVSLPAIHAIRAAYPDHRLILLTPNQPGNLVSPLEILGDSKIFSQVLFYVTPRARALASIHTVALSIKIWRLKPEALFYLRGLPWDHFWRDRFFFQLLCGISKTYGLNGSEDIFGRRDASGGLCRCPSEVERLLHIVAEADSGGLASQNVNFGIPISRKDSCRIDSLWKEAGMLKNELIIALGPGSKMPAKRWPLERFIEIGRYLLAKFTNSRLIVFGGSEDFSLGEVLKHNLGARVLNFAGLLSVLESAEGLRRCSLYVGNDTGVMHLAAAVGTPCVAIFSARDHPGRWEPYGLNHIVLRKNPHCAGCLLQVCSDRRMICLTEITVSEVLEAIEGILKKRGECQPVESPKVGVIN